ncbi:COX4-domain-containing protein, partial [Punctularia strigosozonata HHB-11173 SS5]|uniref:COX4-domain-containing protein n=1 Tax=Punctularia strigosozonata (strain HHB-11173) TaxID=741275 RepID=UPI0004416C1F
MQALRLARTAAVPVARRRCLATAAAPGNHAPTHAPSSTARQQSMIPISNVEAQWEQLSDEDKLVVHQQLEELQKQDWKKLSIDEKKAAYYVAFGPHGPRAPINPPGTVPKIIAGVSALIAVSGLVFVTVRSRAPPPPKTLTKEWEEAANERAIEQKINPISGISSEGYKGKGFV